jgi:Tfp pilus assembly protein PilF
MSAEEARRGRNETVAANAASRSCGTCTLCCKLFDIRALNKPQFEWCKHCAVGVGCRIYEQRPDECHEFNCRWLTDASVGDEWKPSHSRIVLTLEGGVIGVHVDPSRPDAWRKEPYHRQIRAWAARAAQTGEGRVIVWEGPDAIVLLARGDKRLGKVPAGHHIVFRALRDPVGNVVQDAVVVAPDDVGWNGAEPGGLPRGAKDVADVHFSRGLAAAGKGEHEQAVAAFGEALAKDDKLYAAYDARALSLLQLGRLPDAITDSERALALAPDMAGLHNNRAMILCAAGRSDEGMAAFEMALRLDPRYARGYFNRGTARSRAGDAAGARADFTRALELDPKYLPACAERGVLNFSSALFADAARDFDVAARLDPDGPWQLWCYVAGRRAGRGDAQPPAGNEKGPWPAHLAAMFRGEIDETQAISAAPPGDRDAAFFAGEFHLLRGDRDAAAARFRRAVADGNDWSYAYDCALSELRRLGGIAAP